MSCNNWICKYLDENKECDAMGSECIGNLCDMENVCNSCIKQDTEECPEY